MSDSYRPDVPESEASQTQVTEGTSVSHLHSRRKRKKLSRRQLRKKRIKRFGIGTVPFVIFLVSLVLISIGFVQYVEQESIFAVFLTKRDAQPIYAFHGDDWSEYMSRPTTPPTEGSIEPIPTPIAQDERLRVPLILLNTLMLLLLSLMAKQKYLNCLVLTEARFFQKLVKRQMLLT